MATQTTTRAPLEALVESFDRDTAAGREQIRALLERDPQAFQDGVVRVLRAGSHSRGAQYVVSLLVASDYLFGVLCDPAVTREEAIALARTAMQVDNMADINIAKRLADEATEGLSSTAAGRVMEILNGVSDSNRIMPWLLRLMRQPDPQLRSKAVLMIGRASRSVKWVQNRLSDADPRSRANAVEALWGVETTEVRDFLRSISRDNNGRVAANALVGLYRQGDSWMIPELIKMAVSDLPALRASAAWAMGESGDKRFADALSRLMCDARAVVRKRAFSALGRVKSTIAGARQGCQWRVVARMLPFAGVTRQVLLEARPADAGPLPKLTATQFLLAEDGQIVHTYQVETRPAATSLAVSFLLPRPEDSIAAPWVQGAQNCVAWRRPSDLSRIAYYRQGEERREMEFDLPSFISRVKSTPDADEGSSSKSACGAFWNVLHDCVDDANASARGARHLIVYCPEDPGAPQSVEGIISAAIASHICVQAIANAPNPTLEELCRRTRGRFRIALPGDDLCRLVEEAHLALLVRFAITYQPLSPSAASLQIRVADATGWGETTIAL